MSSFDNPESLESSSTIALIKQLSEYFSTNEFGVDHTRAKQLNRIAWKILLKKDRPLNYFEDNGIFEYVHPAILYCLKGDPVVEDEVAQKLDELEKIENDGNSWVGDVLKVLLSLHFSKTQVVNERPKTVQGYFREIFRQPDLNSQCLPKQKEANYGIFTSGPLMKFNSQDAKNESLRELVHGMFSWPDESDDDVASSISSTYNVDEGFVTPGNEAETSGSDDVQHFLFENDVEIPPSCSSWFTEKSSSNDSVFYDAKNLAVFPKESSFSSLEINKCAQLKSHQNDHVLSLDKFVYDLKALLIGISSPSFSKVNRKFSAKESICVIGLSSALVNDICKTFILVGNNYLKLEKCHERLNSSSSVILKSMAPCLEKFFCKYQNVINNISSEQSMLLIKKRVATLGDQIQYLVYFFSPLPKPISLLNHFYHSLSCSLLPSMHYRLVSIFFFSACNAYFNLLDNWIFSGKTHPELFIDQNVSAEELKDCSKSRENFKKAFSIDTKKVPCFLSPIKIFDCGITLVLLNLCSKNNSFDFKNVERPCIQLCRDMECLKKLETDCNIFYESCSSQVVFKWLPKFDIDLKEIANQRMATSAKIYHDIKSLEKVLLRQKQTAQLNVYKETLHHELEAAFIQLKDDVQIELQLKHEEQLYTQKLEDRANKYLNDLLDQFEKLKEENDKANRRKVWKQKRLNLTEKRNAFLSNLGGNDSDKTISSEKSEENGCDNFSDGDAPLELEESNIESKNVSGGSSMNYLPPKGPENGDLSSPSNSNIHSTLVISHQISEYETCSELTENDASKSKDLLSPSDNLSKPASHQISEYETCSDLTEQDHLDDSNQSSFSTCTYDCTVISDEFKKKFKEIKKDEILNKGFSNNLNPFLTQELVTKSIRIPLKIQTKLVNEALLYLFCEENRLFEHFSKIRNYFFLCDGVYTQKLTDALFSGIKKKEPAQFLTFLNLGAILNAACGNENPREVFFDVSNTPPSFDYTNPQVLDSLKLGYKSEWNLSLILTEVTIERCNSVFLFLLAIEYAAWSLKKLMFLLKIKHVDLNRSPKYKQIQLHRHIMFQFITAIKNYLANVVFDTCWNNFTNKLFQVKSLEEIYKLHCDYVKDIRFRCFLNSSSASTLEHLMKILHSILVYCHVYEFGETEIKPSGRFYHQKFAKLEHNFKNFMAEAHYFTYLIETFSQNEQHHNFEILLEYLHTWSRLK